MSDGVFTCHGVEWLAGDTCAFCEVISEEQARIIKLLDADCKDGLGDNIQGCSHEVAIALIKGENK